MFDRFRASVLQVLQVPHDPTPPAGAPGSVRVFRAGRNFYKLRLVTWALGQAGALAGILFSLAMLDQLEVSVNSSRATAPAAAAEPSVAATPPTPPPEAATPAPAESKKKVRPNRAAAKVNQVAAQWPRWVFSLLRLAELAGILLYLVQIPITYAMARLDYELRWYIVTDRSLRIRSGLASVQESTMSFANVQQVIVSQGPVQRVLGIADVRVQSAGGGGESHQKGAGESLHTGVFHGVDNANEIRDLILERLRRFRETGLGDPDEARPAPVSAAAEPPESAALAAAHELLGEARALRQALG